MAINQKIKLLIVDDSIFFRKALAGALVVVNIPRQAARVLETAGLDRYVDLI